MSDHDFEKQVHQKLEELRLRPSDRVWMEVEKNIRQDKRRRRILWLWTAALLIALTTSGVVLKYYHTSGTGKTLDMAEVTPATSSNQPASVSTNSTYKETTPSASLPENASVTRNMETVPSKQRMENDQPGSIPPAEPVTPLPTEKQPANVVTDQNNRKETIGSTYKETIGLTYKKPVQRRMAGDHDHSPVQTFTKDSHESRIARKKKTVPAVTSQTINGVEPERMALVDPAPPTDAFTAIMPVLANDADQSIATSKAADNPANSRSLRLLMPDSTANTTAAALPIQRKRPPAGWHWGIITDAGYARIAESKLIQLRGLFGQAKSENLSYNNTVADMNSLFNIAYAASVKKPSPIQADLSFSVGVFVQRTLSPRFKLSVGLDYVYMSVNTQVGQKINAPLVINTDSTSAKIVDGYYKLPGYASSTTGQGSLGANGLSGYQGTTYYNQKYRYRFQYLEIPILANWQINKGRRMPPVVFTGGISIARLLSADALQFESVKGVYYEDNSLFNKTQFNFVAGLSVGLLQQSKHPIWIGPTFRYGLNGMAKGTGNKQYLWSAGISVKIGMGKL